jgi:DNA-binding CsgD family transcriptional regulator
MDGGAADRDAAVAIAAPGAEPHDSPVTSRPGPASSRDMEDVLNGLAARLRDADNFAAAAGTVIDMLTRRPGVIAVAVEAHDRDGPCAWFGSTGFAPPAGYLDGTAGPAPGRAALVQPRLDRAMSTWLCPIVGCGDLVGALRVRVDPGVALGELLTAICTMLSVRVAQLGGTCEDSLGARALTARQYEVTVLVARGSTNAEIARLLSISPDAVKKHVSRALVALEVSNRTELAAIAGRWRCAAAATPPPTLHTAVRPRRSHAPRSRAA